MQLPKFSSFSILNTSRLLLRFPDLNDTQSVFILRKNDFINKYITRPIPQNLKDVETFITTILEHIKDNKNLYWVIVLNETQEIIGSLGYHHFSDDFTYAEIGYELHPRFHKKGYMSEAIENVIQLGFQDLKLKTIEAFTHKNNEASKSLLIKNKFIHRPERFDEGFENNSIFQLKFSES